jgi:hypothetical protein
MIAMRRRQLSFADGLIAEEVSDLRDGWMEHADSVLADEAMCQRCTRPWQNDIPRAALAGAMARRPR